MSGVVAGCGAARRSSTGRRDWVWGFESLRARLFLSLVAGPISSCCCATPGAYHRPPPALTPPRSLCCDPTAAPLRSQGWLARRGSPASRRSGSADEQDRRSPERLRLRRTRPAAVGREIGRAHV